jgi:hypothetical protein
MAVFRRDRGGGDERLRIGEAAISIAALGLGAVCGASAVLGANVISQQSA